MTECPKCKGYGIVGSAVPDILRGRGAIFSSNECDMCHGSGEVPMTNEEWIKQANTEQLAEWMASVVQKAISIKESNSIVMLESAIWWEEWLKQPHQ